MAGVCAGVAHSLAVPVSGVRLAFIVLSFIHLFGVLLYGALWLIMPPQPGEESVLERVLRWGLDQASRLSGRRGNHSGPPSVWRP